MLELVGKHTFIDTILSWIRRIIAKFQKADSDVEKQIRIELIKIQDAIEKMYKQSQKQGFADDEVKYSLADTQNTLEGDSEIQKKNTDNNGGVKFIKDGVDKKSDNVYNEQRGDIIEKSADSKSLEGRKVSTVSGSKDNIRKQGSNSKKMASYVERYSGNIGQGSKIIAGESGFLGVQEELSNFTRQSRRQRRLFESDVRNLSRVKLKQTDTVGRILPEYVLENFNNTVLKNEDGTILSLYHWTNAIFKTFKKGDVGFHFGVLDAADNMRKQKQKKHPEIKTSIYKETYVNITNPIFIYDDRAQWDALSFVELLRRADYITNNEVDYLCDGEMSKLAGKSYGSTEIKKIIAFLEKKGYDGVIYENGYEGDYSVIAFHPKQIYTVAENGIDIEHEAGLDNSAFSNGEKYSLDIELDGETLEGEVYDTIPPGEKPARVVRVPKKVDGTYTNRFVRTIMEHGDISEFQVELLKDGVWQEAEKFRHKVADDKSARN